MSIKHTLQHVKDCFIKNNCVFLDNEYKNNSYPHNYICKCGNKSKISFSNFKKGNRCIGCSGTPKYNLEYVKKCFLDNNCMFLDDEYVNNKYPHNYQCNCGNKSKISFASFQNGKRCMKCCGKEKLTLEYVKKCFLDKNCMFIDNEYINSSILHNYICRCGQKSKISFSHFKKGVRCGKCAGNEKHNIEYIKKCFLDKKCEFLDNEYVNAHFLHNYICECGNKSKINFNSFQNGTRCKKCATFGFNSSKPSFVYLVGNHYKQKIGIAGENTKRLENHKRSFGMELIDKIDFFDGNDAIKLESEILNILKIKKIPHGKQVFTENFNGVTESWLIKDLEVKSINELINL
jgi:hypothetical protein